MFNTRRMIADMRLYSRECLRDTTTFIDAVISPVLIIVLFGAVFTIPTLSRNSSAAMTALTPGFLSLVPSIAPAQSMAGLASRYKRARLFEELSLTPITKTEWLASKALWYIIVSAISLVPCVAIAAIPFGAHVSLTPWIIPFLALGAVFYTLLGAIIGTVAKSPESANMVLFVALMPLMLFSGVISPVASLPGYAQDIARVLPQFYLVEGLNAVMLRSDYGQATLDLAVILVLTLIVFLLVARLSKWRED